MEILTVAKTTQSYYYNALHWFWLRRSSRQPLAIGQLWRASGWLERQNFNGEGGGVSRSWRVTEKDERSGKVTWPKYRVYLLHPLPDITLSCCTRGVGATHLLQLALYLPLTSTPPSLDFLHMTFLRWPREIESCWSLFVLSMSKVPQNTNDSYFSGLTKEMIFRRSTGTFQDLYFYYRKEINKNKITIIYRKQSK